MPFDFGESKIYHGALEKSLYKPALIWKSFSSDWSPRLYFLLLTHDQSLKLGTVTCRVKSTSVFSVTFKFHTPDKLARQGKKLPAPLKFLWSRLKNYLHTSTKENPNPSRGMRNYAMFAEAPEHIHKLDGVSVSLLSESLGDAGA